MALIISIETSTSASSVALFKEKNLIVANELHFERSHSGALLKMIQNTLHLAGFSLKELEAVAVSKGPGSYTGLRIGTSTAKGLCYSLDIPLIGVNTLEAMANQMQAVNYEKNLLCPMLDARRMEVYCLVIGSDFSVIKDTEAKIINENSFQEYLKDSKIIFFGNGAGKCKNVIKHENAFFVSEFEPNAKGVGKIAYEQFIKKKFEDLAYFEPFYLKDFVGTKPSKK